MTKQTSVTEESIDPVLIAAVVRQVIARLDQQSHHSNRQLITLEVIEQHDQPQLIVSNTAVITPAAQDEATRRGIVITRDCRPARLDQHVLNVNIEDPQNPQRAQAVTQQLKRRGIQIANFKIVLSDCPANELFRQISQGERAVMINQLADVTRFANQFEPNLWVLDMERLNLAAAVNAIAKIAQQPTKTNDEKTP